MAVQHKLLRRPVKAVLQLLYPQQCVNCDEIVAADLDDEPGSGHLCGNCWRDMRFITGLMCHACGAPIPGEDDIAEARCDDCMSMARPWQSGRAAITYAGAGRELVLKFKHGDRPDLAPALAHWLADAATPLLQPGMIIAPVPLHFRRLLRRRYNQAALLSAQLARKPDLKHIPDLLCRKHHTQPQDHRNISDRFANIAGAITLTQRYASQIQGKKVLLIDDVMTSGATLAHATEVLLAAGSGPVSVAVLARTVRDD